MILIRKRKYSRKRIYDGSISDDKKENIISLIKDEEIKKKIQNDDMLIKYYFIYKTLELAEEGEKIKGNRVYQPSEIYKMVNIWNRILSPVKERTISDISFSDSPLIIEGKLLSTDYIPNYIKGIKKYPKIDEKMFLAFYKNPKDESCKDIRDMINNSIYKRYETQVIREKMEELKLKPTTYETKSIFEDVDSTFQLYYNGVLYEVPFKNISSMIFRPYTDTFKREIKKTYELDVLPQYNLFLKISLPLSITSSLPNETDISNALLKLSGLETNEIISSAVNTVSLTTTKTLTEISTFFFPIIICIQQTDLDNEQIYFNFNEMNDEEKENLKQFGDDLNYQALNS